MLIFHRLSGPFPSLADFGLHRLSILKLITVLASVLQVDSFPLFFASWIDKLWILLFDSACLSTKDPAWVLWHLISLHFLFSSAFDCQIWPLVDWHSCMGIL